MRTQHTEIIPSINGRLVYLHSFIPPEIILGFLLEWKVTYLDIQGVKPEITHGFIKEVVQEDENEMKEELEKLRIKRLVNRRNKQQILTVRSISENHIRQERKIQAQWTKPRVGDLVLV